MLPAFEFKLCVVYKLPLHQMYSYNTHSLYSIVTFVLWKRFYKKRCDNVKEYRILRRSFQYAAVKWMKKYLRLLDKGLKNIEFKQFNVEDLKAYSTNENIT